jgi:hypothetical protein
LTIEFKSETGVTHWTLRCDPVGGDAPDAAATCRVLFGTRHPINPIMMHPMSPIMPRIMCPMILISSKQIIVDGTWFGKKVHRVFIDGGCDLLLFNSLVKTFS